MAISIMSLIDFYTAVAEGNITDEVKAKAVQLIEKDAADKERARAKRAEKAAEANPAIVALENALLGVLTSTPQTATDLLTALGNPGNPKTGEPLSKQWVSTHLRKFVEDGVVAKTEIKNGKAKVIGYTAVDAQQ